MGTLIGQIKVKSLEVAERIQSRTHANGKCLQQDTVLSIAGEESTVATKEGGSSMLANTWQTLTL